MQHRNGTTPQNDHDDSFEKQTAIRQSLIELHSCPTHSHPDKKAICWKDGGQGLCYPVTESNLNLWATLHVCDSLFHVNNCSYFYYSLNIPRSTR